MITLPCPQCGGEFMQVETDHSLDLICLACASDRPEARRHARIEHEPLRAAFNDDPETEIVQDALRAPASPSSTGGENE